jgi:eukaryotic-like serine/threonine-protein kinase
MTPERWGKVKDVLGTALDLPSGERERYLDQSCGDDVGFRADVERLLRHQPDVSSRFLNQTALAETAVALLGPEENPWIGRRVGAYQIAELIGTGGMGEVYRAFRADDQYRKEVALKVIRAGRDSSLVVARFRNERQILAGLEHPNIARLLDGGTTEEGLPYLVMELIEGQPISEYCEHHELSIFDRLSLFLQVCAAVQCAHQNLIVHRDLKPGNILVTAEGFPKLLDIGIAKILDVAGGADTMESTLTIFRVLTPQYASPEQVKGQPITTASDVYSLAVVLYELLTGYTPYASSSTVEEATRAVCETEPLKPSTAVRLGKTSERGFPLNPAPSGFAGSRSKLAKQLRGDLDNIILMALRKEPQRRYASVEQFAEDLRRYLQHVPVIARKDTTRYRASKFVMRYKEGVTAAGLVALVLVVGIVITLQEARIARRRFDDVRSLANSLIFDVHDSIKDLPGATPARKIIVDRALQYLNVLAKESSGDVQLQRELANAYEKVGAVQGDYLEHNLGDSAGTLASYHKALDLRRHIADRSSDWNDRLALAQGYRLVAHQMWANGDPRGARDPVERAVAISEALNIAVPNNSKILYELSFDHEVSGRIGFPGDPRAKEKILQEYRRAMAADEISLKITPDDIRLLHGYATDLGDIGNMLEAADPQEALKNYRKGLEIDLKLSRLSPDLRYRRSVAIWYGSIASVYDDIGDAAHSVENNMKDLEIYQELVGADPKNALLQQGRAITYMNTAASCSRAGKISKALEYSSRGLEIMQGLVSSAPKEAFERSIFAAMLVMHGTILTAAGRAEKAIPEIERGRSMYEFLAKAGVTNPANIAASNVKLGEAAMRAGHEDKAAESFHQALIIAEPLMTSDPPDLDALYAAADADSALGELTMKRARGTRPSAEARKSSLAEARSWYASSLNTWHRIQHPNHTAPNSFQVGDPAVVAEKLRETDAAIAALR